MISRLESLSWWVILIPLVVMGLIMVPWHVPTFVGVALVAIGIILCVLIMGVGLFGRNLTYWTRRKLVKRPLLALVMLVILAYEFWCALAGG